MTIDRIIFTPLERDTIARIVWTPLLIALTFLTLLASGYSQQVNDLIISRRVASTGREEKIFWRSGFTITNGLLTVNAPTVSIAGVTGLQAALDAKLATSAAASSYVSLSGSYTNPSWLTSIPFSKLTSLPSTLTGYGITSFETSAFKLTSGTNTLAEGESGLGWVSSRLTLQGGGGSLQWYQDGGQKVMAWSGRIQAESMNLTNVSIFTAVPSGPTAAGEAGQMAFDENFFYVCVALNTWKRAALSSW